MGLDLTTPPIDRVPVVALVASVGGIAAVSRVLGDLPATFVGAVVVLIHQAPEHPSHLVAILQRRCALSVAPARNGMAPRSGQVLVAMPGTHVLVASTGGLVVIDSGDYPPSRPSADLLLATLATALGPRAVAVVLSGGGHDGATGATAVHVCGGTVLATDEASSAAFAMPSATIAREAVVDAVLPLDDIGPALVELVDAWPVRAPRPS